MKKHIALLTIVAAALVAVPTISRAEDKPVAAEQTPAHKKHGTVFHGKVAAVDTTASTITIGQTVYIISADTKINKDGKAATLADITVGAKVGGSYKKDGDKLNVTTINIGEKAKNAKKSAA